MQLLARGSRVVVTARDPETLDAAAYTTAGWLRSAVPGADDGVLPTSSPVPGVAAAHGNILAIPACSSSLP